MFPTVVQDTSLYSISDDIMTFTVLGTVIQEKIANCPCVKYSHTGLYLGKHRKNVQRWPFELKCGSHSYTTRTNLCV